MSLGHIPRLGEVVTGRGDGLSFDVDVVVGVDGEVGVPRPRDRGTRGRGWGKTVTVSLRHHLVERLTGHRMLMQKPHLLINCI